MFKFKHHSTPAKQECTHAQALPRWDRVEDEGKLDRVARWYCPRCDQFISRPPAA